MMYKPDILNVSEIQLKCMIVIFVLAPHDKYMDLLCQRQYDYDYNKLKKKNQII